MAEAYHALCLRCGGPLLPNADGPWTPPWRCDECRVSYYVAELTEGARLSYRREQHDFGHGGSTGHKAVREAVRRESEEAHVRGVSLRREQLGLVPKSTLKGLLKRHRVSEHFASQMHQAAK